MKALSFVGSSLDDLRSFPATVRHTIGVELMRVQCGGMPTDFKPMKAVGAGSYEIRVTQRTSQSDIELAVRRYKMIGG